MRTIYKVDEKSARPHPLAIDGAASVLRAGGLALLPTETVYGIGVAVSAFTDPGHIEAGSTQVNGALTPAPATGYGRIFTLKLRELTQTVPWLVDGPEALDRYGCDITPQARALAEAFWPGALTIVVKAAPCVPAFMQAADGTIALRASASPVIQALIKRCDSPLAVTSANTHGAPAPAAFADVEPRILEGVDVAVDAGATTCRDASTIISLAADEPVLVRQGALEASAMQNILGTVR